MRPKTKNIIIGTVLVGLFSLFAFGSSSNENKKITELKSDLKQTQQDAAKVKEYERAEFDQKMNEIEVALTKTPIREDAIQEVSANDNNSINENEAVNTSNNQEANSTSSNSNTSNYSGGDKDCPDFATHAEAQAFFEAAGADDPHRLDRDGDGIACEDLP